MQHWAKTERKMLVYRQCTGNPPKTTHGNHTFKLLLPRAEEVKRLQAGTGQDNSSLFLIVQTLLFSCWVYFKAVSCSIFGEEWKSVTSKWAALQITKWTLILVKSWGRAWIYGENSLLCHKQGCAARHGCQGFWKCQGKQLLLCHMEVIFTQMHISHLNNSSLNV